MKMTLLSSKHLSPRGNKTGFLRPVLFLLSFLVFSPSVHPQSAADVKLSQILNSGDLLLLEEQYPLLKDSVEIGMLRWMAEAQLGVGLNRLEELPSPWTACCSVTGNRWTHKLPLPWLLCRR